MSNNKGFTLIELLAVITIMGILMMVAIPTVSRTIENSRKDTFIDTAKKYADSAQTMWMGDNLLCMASDGNRYSSSAMPVGTYYIEIDTTSETVPVLLEQGGKSSWGSRDIKGYIKVDIESKEGLIGDIDGNGRINISDRMFYNNIGVLNSFQKKLADVNGDGTADEEDRGIVVNFLTNGTNPYMIGETFYEQNVYFYPTISDNVHGINLNGSANVIESEKIVRGDLVMSGASYDRVALPATALICIER